MKKRFLIYALLIGVVLSGCGKKDTEVVEPVIEVADEVETTTHNKVDVVVPDDAYRMDFTLEMFKVEGGLPYHSYITGYQTENADEFYSMYSTYMGTTRNLGEMLVDNAHYFGDTELFSADNGTTIYSSMGKGWEVGNDEYFKPKKFDLQYYADNATEFELGENCLSMTVSSDIYFDNTVAYEVPVTITVEFVDGVVTSITAEADMDVFLYKLNYTYLSEYTNFISFDTVLLDEEVKEVEESKVYYKETEDGEKYLTQWGREQIALGNLPDEESDETVSQ